METIKLVSSMYSCQDIPIVVFGKRCPTPCLYCGLKNYQFAENLTIAQGLENVIKKASEFKGSYLSPVTDCFLPENNELTHSLLEKTWKLNPAWVPLVITKQIIPPKTIALFCKNKDRLVLQISVPTLREEIAKILEPGSASICLRLEMIRKLTGLGLDIICVVMPYFGFDDPNMFAKKLREAGVKRVITATGVLVEATKRRMLNSKNEEIREVIKLISFSRGQKFIFPKDKRVDLLLGLVSAFKHFGIKSKVCTSDNHDLEESGLSLCHEFKHKNFDFYNT